MRESRGAERRYDAAYYRRKEPSAQPVNQSLDDYYRLPSSIVQEMAATLGDIPGEAGFFQFGPRNLCFGRCSNGVVAQPDQAGRMDVSKIVGRQPFLPELPFSFSEVIDNLRLE